jgi:CRP-like cAMP-binding protein
MMICVSLFPSCSQFLRGTELLGQAPPHLLSQFAEAMDERSVAPGTDVVTQGDAGDEFFVITKGEVQVLLFDSVELARAGNDNPQNPLGSGCKHLATLQRGECFGEMALLKDGGTRSATVRVPFCDNGHGGGEDEDDDDEVEGVATCLVLGQEHFQQLLVPPEDAGGGKSAGASGGASSNASSSGGAGKVGAATNATAATTAGLDGLAPVEDSFDAVRAALVKENRLRLLQQVPLLSSLARDDLCELLQSRSGGGGGGGGKGRRRASSSGTAGFAEAAETGLLRAYQSGDAIATAGATPETLFVIYSGCVERRKEGDEIEYLGSGEYFGVDSLFTNEPLAASFVASGVSHFISSALSSFLNITLLPPWKSPINHHLCTADER